MKTGFGRPHILRFQAPTARSPLYRHEDLPPKSWIETVTRLEPASLSIFYCHAAWNIMLILHSNTPFSYMPDCTVAKIYKGISTIY